MRQQSLVSLEGFLRHQSGAVSLDWIAMGTIVLIIGIATAGSLGDDVDMVRSSMEGLMESLPGGDSGDGTTNPVDAPE
ncbi:MAG: hypothetical protein AAF899_17610 [Pseudomonadota bacterium]